MTLGILIAGRMTLHEHQKPTEQNKLGQVCAKAQKTYLCFTFMDDAIVIGDIPE